jgi:hypothetical protein
MQRGNTKLAAEKGLILKEWKEFEDIFKETLRTCVQFIHLERKNEK